MCRLSKDGEKGDGVCGATPGRAEGRAPMAEHAARTRLGGMECHTGTRRGKNVGSKTDGSKWRTAQRALGVIKGRWAPQGAWIFSARGKTQGACNNRWVLTGGGRARGSVHAVLGEWQGGGRAGRARLPARWVRDRVGGKLGQPRQGGCDAMQALARERSDATTGAPLEGPGPASLRCGLGRGAAQRGNRVGNSAVGSACRLNDGAGKMCAYCAGSRASGWWIDAQAPRLRRNRQESCAGPEFVESVTGTVDTMGTIGRQPGAAGIDR